jgi:hypothetical protein
MAVPKVPRSTAAELSALLDSPEIRRLLVELDETRWTGRPGYPLRTMLGLALTKSLYAIPTWSKTVALVAEHWKLQRVLGCEGDPPEQVGRLSLRRQAARERGDGRALHRRRGRRAESEAADLRP